MSNGTTILEPIQGLRMETSPPITMWSPSPYHKGPWSLSSCLGQTSPPQNYCWVTCCFTTDFTVACLPISCPSSWHVGSVFRRACSFILNVCSVYTALQSVFVFCLFLMCQWKVFCWATQAWCPQLEGALLCHSYSGEKLFNIVYYSICLFILL